MAKNRPLILKNKERRYSFKELGRLLPSKRGYKAVERWCLKGKVGRSGVLVRMEWVHGTSGRESSLEAYHRFDLAINCPG